MFRSYSRSKTINNCHHTKRNILEETNVKPHALKQHHKVIMNIRGNTNKAVTILRTKQQLAANTHTKHLFLAVVYSITSEGRGRLQWCKRTLLSYDVLRVLTRGVKFEKRWHEYINKRSESLFYTETSPHRFVVGKQTWKYDSRNKTLIGNGRKYPVEPRNKIT